MEVIFCVLSDTTLKENVEIRFRYVHCFNTANITCDQNIYFISVNGVRFSISTQMFFANVYLPFESKPQFLCRVSILV